MVTLEQGSATALNLIGRASELLESVGDDAGAVRLRHVAAVIGDDVGRPVSAELEIPLALMRLALALLDRGGARGAGVAALLQHAVDRARGVGAPSDADGIDVALLRPDGGERRGR